jgi:NTP pyrophosphatase (non-canonical NTP hydrolase)
MKFEEYQEIMKDFAVYPRDTELAAISYLALGLNGEAGEVAEQIKKAIRNDGYLSNERREKIIQELGDVLWYITRIAVEFDVSMAEIAVANIEKLENRKRLNQLKHE